MARTVRPVVTPGTMADTDQPDIAADGLRLRPFTDADVEAVIAAFADPDIAYWHAFRVENADEALEWIERTHAEWTGERAGNWAITATDSADVLGRVGMYTNLARGLGEVAYWILPSARRSGVATRATVAVTRWAHDLGIERVELEHSTRNDGSCRVADRAGFVLEGTHRSKEFLVDGWHDNHHHVHLRATT